MEEHCGKSGIAQSEDFLLFLIFSNVVCFRGDKMSVSEKGSTFIMVNSYDTFQNQLLVNDNS